METRAHICRAGGTIFLQDGGTAISAPSIQISCRCEIAEHSNYNFISRSETEKLSNFCTGRNRVGHQEGKLRGRLFAWRQQFHCQRKHLGKGGRETGCASSHTEGRRCYSFSKLTVCTCAPGTEISTRECSHVLADKPLDQTWGAATVMRPTCASISAEARARLASKRANWASSRATWLQSVPFRPGPAPSLPARAPSPSPMGTRCFHSLRLSISLFAANQSARPAASARTPSARLVTPATTCVTALCAQAAPSSW